MSTLLPLATAKEYIQINHTGQDLVINAMIDGIEEWVEGFCGIKLASVVGRIDFVDGGGFSLWPFSRPVTAVSRLDIVRDDSDPDEIETDTFRVQDDQIIRDDEQRWQNGRRIFKVTYTGGHATVPAGLILVMLDLVKRRYDNRGGKQTQSAAGFGTTWQSFLTSDMMKQINVYRRGGAY